MKRAPDDEDAAAARAAPSGPMEKRAGADHIIFIALAAPVAAAALLLSLPLYPTPTLHQ